MSASITERAAPGIAATKPEVDRQARWRDLGRSAELWIPAGFLLLLLLACFLGPIVFRAPSPVQGNIANIDLSMFSKGHLLGTDPDGYDEMSRLLYGGRVSLEVGFGSVFIGLVLGGTLGALAGLKRGAIESLIMRFLDMLLAFPALILAITISSYFGQSELHVIFAIGLVFTAGFSRIARAQTLRYREQPFLHAARLCGTSDRRILLRHIAPNILPNLLTFAVLLVGVGIGLEATLSFLGAGVPPPGPSWGNMITLGEAYLGQAPRIVVIPSIALLLTITSLNLLSDALRSRWASG
jgi:peptide/nickel transport system permease protein